MAVAVGEPSLDSLLKARGLTREKLEVECPIEVCNKLALKLTSWKELCPFIGLDEADEAEIEENHKKHKERKIGWLCVRERSDRLRLIRRVSYGRNFSLNKFCLLRLPITKSMGKLFK